ncbi:replication-relaxation family protein [Spongiibacter tropicus]|uniref:replication-relaxation family protein n=1 Tax=Spongiibacter tropicus TaxID=454602 RepID=UPI0024E22A9C|nr:replication-relaxation family protein [Spongiibacter tropicus]
MPIQDFDYRSARNRAFEKTGLVLRWLYKWEISSRYVIQDLLGVGRSATYQTLAKLEKDGLISWFSMPNCCAKIYHLTQHGVTTAQELFVGHKDEHLNTRFYPSRINTNHCQHDFLVQHEVLRIKDGHKNARFLSDRQLRLREKFYLRNKHKIPDAVVHLGSHKNPCQILIEVQESPMSSFKLELMLSLYAEAIRKDEIQGLIFASTKRHILDHARRMIDRDIRHFNFVEGRWHPISTTARPSPLSVDMVGNSINLQDLRHYSNFYYRHLYR